MYCSFENSIKQLVPIFLILIGFNINGQSNIKVGQESPPIHISTWIKNEPQDKNLTNKFIVLEFWATWCGPCLAAVPHMNSIQARFRQNDLYYISITDESVDKVNRTLKRIDFHSIVATDLTRETFIQYGNGKDGLDTYPLTVLIDNKGLIQWIGEPLKLTDQIMQDFLNGERIDHNQQTILSTPAKPEHNIQNFKTLLTDKNISYHFSLEKTRSMEKSQLQVENVIVELNGFSAKDIYASLFKNNRVMVPKKYDSLRFNLLYKNMDKQSFLSRLENEILNELNLVKAIESKTIDTYMVSIDEPEKLEKTLNKQFASKSMADTKIIFTSYTIQDMVDEISRIHSIVMQYKGDDKKKYDFIIPVDSKESTLGALATYGLRVQNEVQRIEYIALIEKN
jgi:thiol-disulfide isomerase/thioredoxin